MQTAVGFPVLIRAFRLAQVVEGLRPHTISNYTRDVERFGTHFSGRKPKSISTADIRTYVAAFQQDHAPKTVYEAQLALRRFFRFLLREGEISRDPTAAMKLVRYRIDPPPTYTEAEVKRLVGVCDPRTREGIRDRAMVTVLYDTGVRQGELVSMDLPDDSDILEVMGWKDITMLRRYTAAVAGELAQLAHKRYSPGDALKAR